MFGTGVSKGVSRYLFSIQALNHISHTYLLTNQSQNTMEWQIQTWYHSLDINCQGRIWINLYGIYWDIHTKKYPHCKKIAKYTKRKIPASHQGIPKNRKVLAPHTWDVWWNSYLSVEEFSFCWYFCACDFSLKIVSVSVSTYTYSEILVDSMTYCK